MMLEGQRYRGLLIGNAAFPRDPHAFPALNGPQEDIKQLGGVLTDRELGLFDPADLTVLPDRGIQELREAADEHFTTAKRDDVLLLYYSGHGQLDEHGNLYLCASDTRATSLRATALSSMELNNMIDGSAAGTTVIILDCCYSGAFKATAPTVPIAGRGRYVLTSSRSTQLSRAASRSGQLSPFTDQLVRALRTSEPGDQPGRAAMQLTIREIYSQVHRRMTEDAVTAPQLRFSGEGDVAFARRPPAPVAPPQLGLGIREKWEQHGDNAGHRIAHGQVVDTVDTVDEPLAINMPNHGQDEQLNERRVEDIGHTESSPAKPFKDRSSAQRGWLGLLILWPCGTGILVLNDSNPVAVTLVGTAFVLSIFSKVSLKKRLSAPTPLLALPDASQTGRHRGDATAWDIKLRTPPPDRSVGRGGVLVAQGSAKLYTPDGTLYDAVAFGGSMRVTFRDLPPGVKIMWEMRENGGKQVLAEGVFTDKVRVNYLEYQPFAPAGTNPVKIAGCRLHWKALYEPTGSAELDSLRDRGLWPRTVRLTWKSAGIFGPAEPKRAQKYAPVVIRQHEPSAAHPMRRLTSFLTALVPVMLTIAITSGFVEALQETPSSGAWNVALYAVLGTLAVFCFVMASIFALQSVLEEVASRVVSRDAKWNSAIAGIGSMLALLLVLLLGTLGLLGPLSIPGHWIDDLFGLV